MRIPNFGYKNSEVNDLAFRESPEGIGNYQIFYQLNQYITVNLTDKFEGLNKDRDTLIEFFCIQIHHSA